MSFWIGKLTTFVLAYTLKIIFKCKKRFHFRWSQSSQHLYKFSFFKVFFQKSSNFCLKKSLIDCSAFKRCVFIQNSQNKNCSVLNLERTIPKIIKLLRYLRKTKKKILFFSDILIIWWQSWYSASHIKGSKFDIEQFLYCDF